LWLNANDIIWNVGFGRENETLDQGLRNIYKNICLKLFPLKIFNILWRWLYNTNFYQFLLKEHQLLYEQQQIIAYNKLIDLLYVAISAFAPYSHTIFITERNIFT